MTEGNIASWKVKEGDSFSAGDVLLEIETDKASMDVEAQDDGIVAKIFLGDGTKGIKVGSRIGVLAEVGDDISSLEIPADDSAAAAAAAAPKAEEAPKKEAAPQKTAEAAPAAKDVVVPAGKGQNKKYPLLPSVEHLLHEKNINLAEIDKITATGPKGQLLKGDVLAYLGEVPKSYPGELASQVQKLTHLDLSNIQVAPPKEAPKAVKPAAPEPAPAPTPEPVVEDVQVALPISMAAAIEVQKRIQSTLGVYLPISTFIARAADVANDDLPRSKTAKPTAAELFDEVLGLNKVHGTYGVRGNFLPQITALPATAVATVPRVRTVQQKVDVIDFLSGKVRSTAPKRVAPTPVKGPPGTTSVFSVSVPKGDERRAKVFLERVKEVLEEEPGRLVL